MSKGRIRFNLDAPLTLAKEGYLTKRRIWEVFKELATAIGMDMAKV